MGKGSEKKNNMDKQMRDITTLKYYEVTKKNTCNNEIRNKQKKKIISLYK